MRYFVATMIGAAVLATAVVSVRLHLHVAQMRYGLYALEEHRVRAERELRHARAELEAAKAPRRLMDRWAQFHAAEVASAPAAPREARPVPPEGVTPPVDEPREPEPSTPPEPEAAPDPAPAAEEEGR